MSRLRGAILTAVLVLPLPALAYRGIGRSALEHALGTLPESKEQLEAEVERLRQLIDSGSASPKDRYAAAVAMLNRPRSIAIDEARRLLPPAFLADPTLMDALELWASLLPPKSELGRIKGDLDAAAASSPESAARSYMTARVLHLLESYGDAERAAERAEALDVAFRGRVQLLLAAIASERDDADAATRHMDACLAAMDDVTAGLLWDQARLVATPEEVRRHETLGIEALADFFRGFWKIRDVFPLTDYNERLAEHFRRLKHARHEYALRSNGQAYLTTHDAFKELSPDLEVYASDLVYEYQESVKPWLDHRGLLYVRHGEADRYVRTSQGVRSETWLYHSWTSRPLLLHFVDRRGVGEMVLTLNLAQALTGGSVEDDPEVVMTSASDFRELYGSRGSFHAVFQQVALSQSRLGLEDLLKEEAGLMAGFIRESWSDDSSNLIEKDDFLPFAAYSVNYRAGEETVDTVVYYAIPEKELEEELKKPGPAFEFDATIVVYSANWQHQVATADHHFRYERTPGKKPDKDDLLVGVLELKGLAANRYNYAFQVRERSSDKIGISKGQLIADYFGPGWVGASELLLAHSVTPATVTSLFERNGQRIVPIPTRTVRRGSDVAVYYELYDLQAGADGKNHYSIEYKILQIQKDPSVATKILGIGMNIASLFFPYQVFLAQAGMFGLDVATTDPDKGLDIKVEEREALPSERSLAETYTFSSKPYPAGIYQIYATVKDHVSGSLTTRSLQFAVVN